VDYYTESPAGQGLLGEGCCCSAKLFKACFHHELYAGATDTNSDQGDEV
jgi:hypothetical protein